jgi:hypothetical protein
MTKGRTDVRKIDDDTFEVAVVPTKHGNALRVTKIRPAVIQSITLSPKQAIALGAWLLAGGKIEKDWR